MFPAGNTDNEQAMTVQSKDFQARSITRFHTQWGEEKGRTLSDLKKTS